METIQYGQGPLPFEIPADATTTEITPYLWPGHYGEWDEAAQSFTAWSLVSPLAWRVTSEILAPPVTCLSVGATVTRLRWQFGPLVGPQEFHVELCRSSQLSDLSLTDQMDHYPGLDPKTHAIQSKIHPAIQSKAQAPQSKAQTSQSKIHPGLEAPAKGPEAKGPTAKGPEAKGPEAVWRIHTRVHKT